MEAKKNPRVSLEKKRILFLQIGFLIALSVVLIAFEYKSYEKTTYNLGQLNLDDLEEEIIPITPPPEKEKAPQPEQIIIVENDVVLNDSIIIEDTESDEDEVIEIEEEDDEEFFMVVESMPEFKCMKFGRKKFCGDLGLMKYFAENTKYPPIAKEYNITGKVYVQFIVEKDGSVTNVKVAREIDKHLDAEAVRVVKSLPKYKPGKQRGRPVRVMFTVPITFELH